MRWRWVLVATVWLGCERAHEPVAVAVQSPDAMVLRWEVSRGEERTESFTVHADGHSAFVATSPGGKELRIERRLPSDELDQLQTKMKEGACCSLRSASEAALAHEGKPSLTLRFDGLDCEVSLWDHEWLVGAARECGFVVARVHGQGFVPDPPPERSAPPAPTSVEGAPE